MYGVETNDVKKISEKLNLNLSEKEIQKVLNVTKLVIPTYQNGESIDEMIEDVIFNEFVTLKTEEHENVK